MDGKGLYMRTSKMAALALALMSLLLLFQPAAATNDPPAGGGWVIGNWTVVDARSYKDVSIVLDHGNLVIRSGGSLTLDHTSLQLRMDASGDFQIEVEAGGTLILKNRASITCANPDLRYNFRIRTGAVATLGNSTVRNAGYTYDSCPADNKGIYIASSNVTVDTCTIADSTYGVYIAQVSPAISNCVFRNLGSYGIYADRSASVLSGNDFTSGYIGIYCYRGGPRITRSAFSTNYYGVYAYYSPSTRVDNSTFKDHYYDGVLATYYSNVDVRDCTFTHNGNYDWWYGAGIRYNEFSGGTCRKNVFTSADYGNGVACDDSADPWIDDCDMDTSYRPGVFSDYYSTPRVTNTSISVLYESAIISSGSARTEVSRCNLNSDWSYGISVYGYGELAMYNTTVRAQNSYGMYLASSGRVVGRDSEVSSRYDGAYCNRGILELARCNVTSAEYSGLLVYFGSRAIIEDRSNIKGDDIGIYVYSIGAYASVRYSTVQGTNSIGMVVTEGRADLVNSSIFSTRSYGMYSGSGGVVSAVNSSITSGSSSYLYFDTGGRSFYDFTAVIFDHGRVVLTEPTSILNVSYLVNIAVQWPNAVPAGNASIVVKNVQGEVVLNGRVNQKGELNWNKIQEYSRSQLVWENYTKHEFTAEKNGVKKSVKWDIRSTPYTAIRLTLNDPDPPKIGFTSPPNNLYTNSSRVDFTGTAEDFASGLSRVEYSVDGGNWLPVTGLSDWNFGLVLSDGRHVVKAKAYDIAGISQEAAVTVLVDTVISLELERPAEGALLNNHTVTISGTAEPYSNVSSGLNSTVVDSEGTFEFVVRLEDGPHDIPVIARDDTGNARTVVRRITVDTVPPDLLLITPIDGAATRSPLVAFRGETEPGARLLIGGNQYFPAANGSFTVMVQLKEGGNTIEVRSTDPAGNFQNLTVALRLNTVPPRLLVTKPADAFLTNEPVLKVAGETDASSVTAAGVAAELSGGRFSAEVLLSEGLNYVEVLAQDFVGNQNATTLEVVLDTRSPYIQLVSPTAGFITNNAALALSGVSEPGANITVNGATAGNSNGSFGLSVRLVSGENILTVKAVDRAGNFAYANRTVVLDQIPPVLLITQPGSGSRTSNSRIMVRGSTDPGGTVTVNGIRAQMDDTGRFGAEISLSEGENSIVVTAVDPAGNPTTRIIRLTLAGSLSITGPEMPLVLLGLALGAVLGVAVGLFIGRRRHRAQPVELAPEEPVPGRYDVPDEPVRTDAPPPATIPAPASLPPPDYARHDEAYHPPEPVDRAPEYGPPPAPLLPSVPAPESAPPEEPGPEESEPREDHVPWEEERPAPKKGPDQLDKSLDDIMSRLKT